MEEKFVIDVVDNTPLVKAPVNPSTTLGKLFR